jgi:hypothetical protein
LKILEGKGWGHGSNGGTPASQAQGPEFKLSTAKKKKNRPRLCKINHTTMGNWKYE